MTTTISDTPLITVIISVEVTSIATLTIGVALPLSTALALIGLFLGLGLVIAHKTNKIFESKAKKCEKIKTQSRG